MQKNTPSKNKIHLVSVNMGYGHQRTAFSLKDLAIEGKAINANDYKGIPEKDKKIWQSSQNFYEFISRFKKFPLLGDLAFKIFDQFQKILDFYPKRDLSNPTITLKKMYSLIEKGWGENFIKKLAKNPKPIVTSFFIPAFMAEFFNYPADIYCVICDADVSRSWASLNPQTTRIKYFAPNERVKERLELYGVKDKNIFLTGYPLPMENIGNKKEILKKDLKFRLLNLDPQKKYFSKYESLITKYIGKLPKKSNHILTILFSVGGAGAQKEIAINIVKGLKQKLINNEIKIVLSAGIKEKVNDYFKEEIKKLKLDNNKTIEILYSPQIYDYFNLFNARLRTCDILWTKPSEMSFYSALGLPIILAPTIGSQEDFNKEWLFRLGTGIPQKNPLYANQWLFDFLAEGRFAEAAMDGYIKAISRGARNIERIIFPPVIANKTKQSRK